MSNISEDKENKKQISQIKKDKIDLEKNISKTYEQKIKQKGKAYFEKIISTNKFELTFDGVNFENIENTLPKLENL